jgi:diphthamide synthase (EF-2-diphthine--ammonia ligase)
VTENDELKATIDREAELLASAVRLVASGGARRTTVGGLRLSEAAIAIVRPMAADLGIELEPLWRTDEEGLDVLVRRVAAPEGPA